MIKIILTSFVMLLLLTPVAHSGNIFTDTVSYVQEIYFDNVNNIVNFYSYTLNNINNIVASGNITGENVFIPADIFIHTDDSKAVTVVGTWHNITLTHNTDTVKYNIEHNYNDATNDTVTILAAGIYDISYHGRFNDSAANPNSHAVMRIIVNGEELHGSGSCTPTTKQNDQIIVRQLDSHALLEIGDKIKLQMTAGATTITMEPCSSPYIVHGDSASLSLHKIR